MGLIERRIVREELRQKKIKTRLLRSEVRAAKRKCRKDLIFSDEPRILRYGGIKNRRLLLILRK